MEKTYRLFQSTVRSNVELSLPEGVGELNIFDVSICLDPKLECAPTASPIFERCAAGIRMQSNILCALVSETGNSVRLYPMPGVGKELLTLGFLGGILQTVLFFRGMLQLHASAICDDNGATCFCGVSGAGKSTTAALCVRNGFRLIDEDRPIVGMMNSQPYVFGNNHHFSLLADVTKRCLGKDWVAQGIRYGARGVAKESYLPGARSLAASAPLKRIVFLRNDLPPGIHKCSGALMIPNIIENLIIGSWIQIHYPDRMFELIEKCFEGIELLAISRPKAVQWWPEVEGLFSPNAPDSLV